jgi:hypothetical protein
LKPGTCDGENSYPREEIKSQAIEFRGCSQERKLAEVHLFGCGESRAKGFLGAGESGIPNASESSEGVEA